MNMRGLSLFCGIVCINAAFGMELPHPPGCTEIDAEASANAVLGVSARDLSELCIRVSFDSAPTNAVVVALGRDADGDGTLAPSEEEMSFGCDCGTEFNAKNAKGRNAKFAKARRFCLTQSRWERRGLRRKHGGAEDDGDTERILEVVSQTSILPRQTLCASVPLCLCVKIRQD